MGVLVGGTGVGVLVGGTGVGVSAGGTGVGVSVGGTGVGVLVSGTGVGVTVGGTGVGVGTGVPHPTKRNRTNATLIIWRLIFSNSFLRLGRLCHLSTLAAVTPIVGNTNNGRPVRSLPTWESAVNLPHHPPRQTTIAMGVRWRCYPKKQSKTKSLSRQGSLRQLLRNFIAFRRFGVFNGVLFSSILYHRIAFSYLKNLGMFQNPRRLDCHFWCQAQQGKVASQHHRADGSSRRHDLSATPFGCQRSAGRLPVSIQTIFAIPAAGDDIGSPPPGGLFRSFHYPPGRRWCGPA